MNKAKQDRIRANVAEYVRDHDDCSVDQLRAVATGDTVAIKVAAEHWVTAGLITWRADRFDSRRRRLRWQGPTTLPEVLRAWDELPWPDPDDMWTTGEAARFLGVHPNKLRASNVPSEGVASNRQYRALVVVAHAVDVAAFVDEISVDEAIALVAGGDR